MIAALIALIVLVVAWSGEETKRKNEIKKSRERTVTNVKVQDYLDKQHFKEIMAALEKMDKVTPLFGDVMIDALEFLFELYDIPDERTDDKKTEARESYKSELEDFQRKSGKELSEMSLPQRIWCTEGPFPYIENPELLFGERDTKVAVDGAVYDYGSYGIPSNLYGTVPSALIGRIRRLLTIRELKADGYNYSWNREESWWQRAEQETKEYSKKREKYPWLY